MTTDPDPALLAKAMSARDSIFLIIAVKNTYKGEVSTGTGFVIEKTGDKCILVTCDHVIRGDSGFYKKRDRIFVRRKCDEKGLRVREYRGHLMFNEKYADLAFIEIKGVEDDVAVLKFARANQEPPNLSVPVPSPLGIAHQMRGIPRSWLLLGPQPCLQELLSH